MTTSFTNTFENVETQRLRDLLPASLRPLVTVVADFGPDPSLVIRLQRRTRLQSTAVIAIHFDRWQGIPTPQRDLLFLREVGKFDVRNWLQPGLYQSLALVGGLGTLVEVVLHNPLAILFAGGMTGLAVKQIWDSMNGESAQLDADEFALKRAQFRGYDRTAAARHLLSALETVQKVDRTDVTTLIRMQRLQAIARESSPS